MTATSWKGSIPGTAGTALMVTVRCRGEGSILVREPAPQRGAWSANGTCVSPELRGPTGSAVPGSPDGTTEFEVTAPPGSEWALLVTEAPPGTLLD